MKLKDKDIEKIIKVNPFNASFDICFVCDGVENYGQMSEFNQVNFDLICDDCKGKR